MVQFETTRIDYLSNQSAGLGGGSIAPSARSASACRILPDIEKIDILEPFIDKTPEQIGARHTRASNSYTHFQVSRLLCTQVMLYDKDIVKNENLVCKIDEVHFVVYRPKNRGSSNDSMIDLRQDTQDRDIIILFLD